MNYLSPRKFRNRILLSQESPNQIDFLPGEYRTRNMENINNEVSEQSRTRSPFHQTSDETQR